MRKKQGCKELYQMDAALETFDKFDEEVVKQEITSQERHEEECGSFAEDYKEKKKQTDEKNGVRRPLEDPGFPKFPKFVPTVDMETLNRYKPPGSYMWRGLVKGTSHGHLKPYKRTSEAWSRNGEVEACVKVLRTLWRQWLEMNAYEVTDCPVPGLFDKNLIPS